MQTATVVGCGIVGLTSAIILQEKGFKVRILAKEKFENTLSNKVGAIWFPFEVHPIDKATIWAGKAYQRYLEEEAKHATGVSFIPFMVAYTADSNTEWTQQLPQNAVREAEQTELPNGCEMAKVAFVPLAEPPLYLPYLFEEFIANGGEFHIQTFDTLDQLAELDNIVINCTGLGAKHLCKDSELVPMRGQILRCEKMGIPSCVNSTKKGALSYVINRSHDCIIGGTDYENDWNENIEQSDTDLISNRLKQSGLSENAPIIIEELVGLRPKRSAVRFEFDLQHPNLFHNYGHGGSGFTVAWGCAIELGEICTH